MAASGKTAVTRLYRQMLRTSQNFSGYNFREYAIRRIRDGFKMHKSETNAEQIEIFLNLAKTNLAIIQRQVTIGNLYKEDRIVVEKK